MIEHHWTWGAPSPPSPALSRLFSVRPNLLASVQEPRPFQWQPCGAPLFTGGSEMIWQTHAMKTAHKLRTWDCPGQQQPDWKSLASEVRIIRICVCSSCFSAHNYSFSTKSWSLTAILKTCPIMMANGDCLGQTWCILLGVLAALTPSLALTGAFNILRAATGAKSACAAPAGVLTCCIQSLPHKKGTGETGNQWNDVKRV